MTAYRAAIEGLKRANTLGADESGLRMDSDLVVKQLQGVYQVRNAGLKPLYAEPSGLLASFKKATVVVVRRDQNSRADALANLALDNADLRLHDSEKKWQGRLPRVSGSTRLAPPRTRLVLSKATRLLQD